ncbi:CaiB/BaiF CoA transferase family protein [Brevibacterium album]|uniref:CaiB/BaiF CoA transferase family protein n=1 Tax=Brevibacterium album TaxID=417948 RepID=UPI000A073AEB|nr:CoA transferase [Brevibacterium album]
MPPLEGLLVIDLSRYIAGPYCTMLMADAGATVIKVEPPQGDDTRSLEPAVVSDRGAEVSTYFLRMNRGKRSIVLDLKDGDDRDLLERLIERADILVENYAAGVFERLGFGAQRVFELNPGIVYASISGFGHSASPMRDRAAYNIVAEYEAGVFFQRDPAAAPAPLGPPVGDMFPALHALSGLLMALHRKQRTGVGGRVDIAMYDSMLSLNELRSSYAMIYGEEWDPSAHPFYSPYGVFPVKDGHVCIDVTTSGQWEGFCSAIGRPDLFRMPGMETGPQRVERFEEIIKPPLDAWLSGQTRDSAVAGLTRHRVPCAAIRASGEALTSEQATAREMRVPVRGEDGVVVTTVGNPIKVDGANGQAAAAAPELDAHRDWVLKSVLGLGVVAAGKEHG